MAYNISDDCIDLVNRYKNQVKRLNESYNQKTQSTNLLKEDVSSYPNFNQDVTTSIEATKKALLPFIVEINPKDVSNLNNTNIIMKGSTTIKSYPFTFTYSLDENGVMIGFPQNVGNLPLYNEIIDFMVKLKSNYDLWRNGWGENLSSVRSGTDRQ